jgi:hypothetical protein
MGGIDRVRQVPDGVAVTRTCKFCGLDYSSNAKLRRIAEIVRDAGRNQVQEIMEVLLQPQAASVPARGDDPEATSENSIGHKKRAR